MDGLEDPRLQPGAYLRRGPRMYEVVEIIDADEEEGLPRRVGLLNLTTMHHLAVPVIDVVSHEWQLVLPIIPDFPDGTQLTTGGS